jgi:hypothetical protein
MGVASRRFLDERVPRLVSLPGQAPLEHRIRDTQIVIGSDASADFFIDDPTVAPRHAQIVKRRRKFFLSSLVPQGTFLDGNPIPPRTAVRLSRGDDIQLGSLHFTFLTPQKNPRQLRHQFRLRLAIEGSITAILIAVTIGSYLWPRFSNYDFWSKFRLSVPAAQPEGVTWMQRLNHYRSLARQFPVSEDPALSKGAVNHARYVVANYGDMIRKGKIDASIHTEDPKKPFYTPEGKKAGEQSDIDAVYTSPPETPDATGAIENWITGPLHRMWMMNPRLRDVGYGEYCQDGVCASVLNVRSGVADDASSDRSIIARAADPVMFPPDGATIHNGTFSAEESEWPDPLATCGYATPTGLPITLQISGKGPVSIDNTSITHNGSAVESCAFDASSYRSGDDTALQRTRKQLNHFGAIVIIPKKPLAGGTYTVSVKASGRSYKWYFSVEPR